MIIALGYRAQSQVRQPASVDGQRYGNRVCLKITINDYMPEKAEREFYIYRPCEIQQLESDFDKMMKQLPKK